MSGLTGLAVRSLWNRRGAAALTVFAIAVSAALLLSVEKLRIGARDSFASTVSGTDLLVGARTGPVNLMLYALFRIGDATTNVSWDTYQIVARHRDVAWTIPLALGDSHRGFRVLGTSPDYFRHYHYGPGRRLEFASGRAFAAADEAVLGAEVARALHYRLGTSIVVSHGIGATSFVQHAQRPLRVVGILAPTGTPVDRTVHVTLGALEVMHGRSEAEASSSGLSAFLVGMKRRDTVFLMQRALNEYRGEAVQAVIPGVALAELWSVVSIADRALLLVACSVALAGLLGMVAVLLTSLGERRREMAILRSVGASPRHVAVLLLCEAAMLAAAGAVAGAALAYAALYALQPWIAARFGLYVALGGPTRVELGMLVAVVCVAVLLAMYPAWRAYRTSLADGLTVRM